MARTTIDFGIDLGTTNSEIAVLKGTEVEVFKNNENEEYTPSVVWIRDNRLIVGRKAKERLFEDPENAYAEFKLRMGTGDEYVFKRGGRKMKPEDLSAEVLKSLKADVKQRTGEDIEAAVITVPADFQLPQNQATGRAAQLAGFSQSPLLQEPVAAALTHGFQSKENKVFWLVYDFGGGTFDAALIQLKDGQIDVVNHEGDNQLGGKLIDWAIVDQILVPAVTRQCALADFRRGNPAWVSAFAKLKLKAEAAKISLSRDDTADLYIDPLCKDGHGRDVSFEFEISRKDVERLIDPFVERSINICRKVLEGAKLKASAVERLILVGGPTLTPYLRERLSDPRRGLGIELDYGADPLTVVARGAAIFAGTQVLQRAGPRRAPPAGKVALELVFDPISNDPEPPVSGKVLAPAGQELAGCTIEFVNAGGKPPWRSGRVSIPANGAFLASLWVQEGRQNVFRIEFRDAAGTLRETEPAEFSVTPGVRPGAAPLTHSVGVAMANGETDFFIQKNTPLPAQRRQVHRTVRDARRGAGHVLKIPVVEGQSPKADRNRLIGTLEIPAGEIRRDLPAGSEVEITIKIDASRLVTSKAYVPYLDQEFEKVLTLQIADVSADQLEKDVEYVKQRLEGLREKVAACAEEAPEDPDLGKARKVLDRIDAERMELDVDETFRNAGASKEEASKCHLRVQNLNLALDELEDALQWPDLKAKADAFVGFMTEIVGKFGKSADRARAAALERECRAALEARNAAVVNAKIRDIGSFTYDVWRRDPSYWVEFLRELEEKRDRMTDPAMAEQLFNRGRVAITEDDLPALQAVVKQLYALVPPGTSVEPGTKYGGDTVK